MSHSQRCVLLLVAVSLLFGLFLLTIKNGVTQSKPSEQESTVKAIRRGGLREAARIKGQYKGTVRTTGWGKYDLEGITSNSSNIVIGVPSNGSSAIAGTSGQTIETQYKVKVERVLKGKPTDSLNLIVLGGKVTFDDGTSAEIVPEDLGPIVENQEYIFFLRPNSSNADAYSLTGGGQGLFELTVESKVKARGHKTDTVQKNKDQWAFEFINEIEAAVKKYPNTSSCCR